ncbi:aconitase family protein [Falsochrobactrum sp. TDYN1]|uniref:Aconitase family protein n=1 Tax=Falsochrobactrum tianjinense TaxID=2706015 RepID=A0A949PJR7_9HYPH|nr:aconitase family protein [Falsochrobactrum sp. TDYN1]MBV2142146.1 aconitase family protein [Falsochrobactrum sp. TDYN1]
MNVTARSILSGTARGPILATSEPLSFWGGVDPASGKIIDVHHPLYGQSIAGAVLMIPSTRGSCTGSGILLDLVLNSMAPAALVFSQAEDVVTLGALIADKMFGRPLPVLRLQPEEWARLSQEAEAEITPTTVTAPSFSLPVAPPEIAELTLTQDDGAMLSGAKGEVIKLAMEIICTMAANQGAEHLIDVAQAHIDGCIYASHANLIFAEKMADMGARVRVPTTMNAISVDRERWQAQGVPVIFGQPAARLADAYVRMGCQNTFTCSPYLLETAPVQGEMIAWAESNAVIYANTVLGARTTKHPDFLDLCIAITGRAPLSGVYLDQHRLAQRIININVPNAFDDAFWPLIGYLAGKISPDRIPLLRGLEVANPSPEDLKALCAAFGTTSAAPMLHVDGITPEAHLISPSADTVCISNDDMAAGWRLLNGGPDDVDLIAIGSPHASLEECRTFADALRGGKVIIKTIITAGRQVIATARSDGTLGRLEAAGVQVIPDLCWCSISEPVFPSASKTLMTNSGKYAHYGPALSGRAVRFGSLMSCAQAALTGHVAPGLPGWLRG